jgi:hypothetical protein
MPVADILEITPNRDLVAVLTEQPKIIITHFPGLYKAKDKPKKPLANEENVDLLQRLKKQIDELTIENKKLLQNNVRWEKEHTDLQRRELQLKSERVTAINWIRFFWKANKCVRICIDCV